MSIDKLRAESALKLLFMADALYMPVHWYYNIKDIQHQFPGGIRLFEAAPAKHPSSIMHYIPHRLVGVAISKATSSAM